MTDTLRDRIAAVLREHVEDQLTNYDAGRNECGCGNQGLSGYVEHVADAVIAELTEAIPPIVATAIQGYVLAELAAISHHGQAGEYEVLKRLDSEALQIARYATTHKDWND